MAVGVVASACGRSGVAPGEARARVSSTTVRAGSSAPSKAAVSFDLPAVRAGQGRVTVGPGLARPVLVNFFASWCDPCRRELPMLVAASRRMAGRVDTIGVDTRDGRTSAVRMLDEFSVPYPAAYDPDGTVAARMGFRGLPATALVGVDGRVIEQVQGELTARRLDDLLARAGP